LVWQHPAPTPIVWHIAFPPSIAASLVSEDNPSGNITNSNLEMAGLLCHWLVLEQFASLAHAHVAASCDYLPIVAWATCLLSSKAKVAAHLLHILALCMLAQQASLLTTYHLPGASTQWQMRHPACFAPTPRTWHSSSTSTPLSPPTGQLVATLLPPQQTLWQDLLGAANHHIATGVVAANNQQCNHHWHHWCAFLPTHINPYLQDMPCKQQLAILQAFINWTCCGNLGCGNQVKANSVQDAVSAIGKTFELAGLHNPLYPLHGNKYHLCIAQQIKSF